MMENRLDLLTQKQIDWCNEYCNFEWFVKDDGKVYSKSNLIHFKNKNRIFKFLVKFGDCEYFSCYNSQILKSLEGAPDVVNEDFDCSGCKKLKSLKGSSKTVGKKFNCSYCISLISLEGSPEFIGELFICSSCILLESLEGAPKSVGGNFSCSYCKSLKSLRGISHTICKNFSCNECNLLESIDYLKESKIKGCVFYLHCPKLKKYDLILSDMNWFRKWQKSEYTADEFMKEYDGFLQAQKYGI